MTKRQYIEYLIATQGNYTCTHLAAHLEGKEATSHDTISDYLRREKLTPRSLWEIVQPLIVDSPEAFLIVDDSVQDKRYSTKIGMVRRQYSGAEHGLVRGIGVVNLLHTSGERADFYPVDYRLFDPDVDGKTKHEHFREMLVRAKADKQIQARTILFDSWYAAADTLKMIHRLGMVFITGLKSNRRVSLSKEDGYIHLQEIVWTDQQLRHGSLVKLKALPFPVRLFKLVASDGDIDWIVTNRDLGSLTADEVQQENAVRWQIEQMHRELKQLVGSERCQCRAARSQRNHLACCYQAWVALKVKAKNLGRSLYAVQSSLFSEYLRAELRAPRVPAITIL